MRSKLEQETSITFNAKEPTALLWTCDPDMKRRLRNAGFKRDAERGDGDIFTLPRKVIIIKG